MSSPRGAQAVDAQRARAELTNPGNFFGVPPAARPLAREFGDWRVWLLAGARLGGLQGSHPTVAAGLRDHSSGASDPLPRLQGTLAFAMRIFYGDDPAAVAAEIRELHRDIKGVRDDGRAYHAWNRDAWAWVHNTTIEALLYATDVLYGPLDPGDVDAMYGATRWVAMTYGIREEDLPADPATLRAYVEDGARTKLDVCPAAEYLHRTTTELEIGPLTKVPARVRRLISGLLSPLFETFLYGFAPLALRELWGVRWTGRHRLTRRALLIFLRSAAVLPDRWRMVPDAYRALNDSRVA